MATDYPEDVILKNLNTNFEVNCGKQVENGSMKVVGHVWGKDIPKLISANDEHKYDIVILSVIQSTNLPFRISYLIILFTKICY